MPEKTATTARPKPDLHFVEGWMSMIEDLVADIIEKKVAAERERCEQLFLLFAYDWWGEKIKDSSAKEAIVEMLKDILNGAKPHARAVFNLTDPNHRGLPTILLYDTEADFSQDATSANSPSTTSSPATDELRDE